MRLRRKPEWYEHPATIAATGALVAGLIARQVVRSKRYMDLSNRVVVITGGSRGLGLVLARECVDRGARVAICARDEEELERARRDLIDRGLRRAPFGSEPQGRRQSSRGDVLAVQCDITVQNQVDELIRGTAGHFGTIDMLINNAGVIQVGPESEMTLADYDEALKTHLAGPLFATQAVLPIMRGKRDGRIVNITSIGGKVPAPHLLPYTATKFALVGFSEGLRAELTKDNIFVTTVVPGLMRTGSPRNALFKGRHQKEYAWFATADVLPIVSISARRMARKILDAAQHGQAELIAPWTASLQARLHGLFPGATTELASLFNMLLPGASGEGRQVFKGYESESSQTPRVAQKANDEMALKNNEIG
jgi:NAD(P)-dependent dehydrogenase (short-subunit alcohol dehydrogenase family)